jgi:tetratricopeptide (TPR) repeat protein
MDGKTKSLKKVNKGQKGRQKGKQDPLLNLSKNMALKYFKSGKAHFQAGEYSAAEADFDRAITINPNYGEAYDYLSLCKEENLQQRRTGGYEMDCPNQDKSSLHFSNARSLMQSSEYEKAEEELSKAINASAMPNYDFYLLRGQIRHIICGDAKPDQPEFNKHKGILTSAIKDFDKAISISPNRYEAHFDRAKAYDSLIKNLKGGERETAEKERKASLEKTIETNPSKTEAYLSLVDIVKEENDSFGSFFYINKAIQYGPTNPSSYVKRAELWSREIEKGNRIEFFDHYNYKSEGELENMEFLGHMAYLDLLFADGLCDRKVNEEERHKIIYQRCKLFYDLLGYNLINTQESSRNSYNKYEFKRAIRFYSEGLREYKESLWMRLERGDIYYSEKNFGKALKDYETVLENLKRHEPDVKLGLLGCHYRVGKAFAVYYRLATLYENKCDYENALKYYDLFIGGHKLADRNFCYSLLRIECQSPAIKEFVRKLDFYHMDIIKERKSYKKACEAPFEPLPKLGDDNFWEYALESIKKRNRKTCFSFLLDDELKKYFKPGSDLFNFDTDDEFEMYEFWKMPPINPLTGEDKIFSSFMDAYFRRAILCENLGKFDMAESYYEELVNFADYFSSEYGKGVEFFKSDKFAKLKMDPRAEGVDLTFKLPLELGDKARERLAVMRKNG